MDKDLEIFWVKSKPKKLKVIGHPMCIFQEVFYMSTGWFMLQNLKTQSRLYRWCTFDEEWPCDSRSPVDLDKFYEEVKKITGGLSEKWYTFKQEQMIVCRPVPSMLVQLGITSGFPECGFTAYFCHSKHVYREYWNSRQKTCLEWEK